MIIPTQQIKYVSMNHNTFRIIYTAAEEAAIARAIQVAINYMARFNLHRRQPAQAITDPEAYAGYSCTSPNGRTYIPALYPPATIKSPR